MGKCEKCGNEIKYYKEGDHEYFWCPCGTIEVETVATSEEGDQ